MKRRNRIAAFLLTIPLVMGADSCNEGRSTPSAADHKPCDDKPCPGGDPAPSPPEGEWSVLYQAQPRAGFPQKLTVTYTLSGREGKSHTTSEPVQNLVAFVEEKVPKGTRTKILVERHGNGGPIRCGIYRMKKNPSGGHGTIELIDEMVLDSPGAADCSAEGVV